MRMKTIILDGDIEPLVDAVIEQESGGDQTAESEVGAKGLMQLLDATGFELYEKYREEIPEGVYSGAYAPFNGKQNKFLGTKYLGELLMRFKGDAELALAAYHTGMGTIGKLLLKHNATTFGEIRGYLGPIGQKYPRKVLDRLRAV